MPPVGFTLLELIIALMLLGAASAVLLPVLVTVSAQRRAAEQRQYALILAENLLDDLVARSWDDIAQESSASLVAGNHAPDALQGLILPGLERVVTVTNGPDADTKQISLELRWCNRAGDVTRPIRLSAWKFAPPEVKP